MLAMTCEKSLSLRALSVYLDFIGSATDEQWLLYFPFPPKERQTSLRRSVSSHGVSLAIQFLFVSYLLCDMLQCMYKYTNVMMRKRFLCLGTSLLEVLCCVCRSPFQT